MVYSIRVVFFLEENIKNGREEKSKKLNYINLID